MIEIGVLGPLTVRADGTPVAVPGRRERCVLANLALAAGDVVPTTTLIDRLWGDGAPRTAHKSVQTAVVNLRAAMREARAGTAVPDLATEGRAYRLLIDPHSVDVGRFDFLAEAGRVALARSAGADALGTLSQALMLWRGTEPAELGDGISATIEVQRLRERRLEVLADRLDAELLVGRHGAVLAELGSLCRTWPHRERFHELLMLALYRSGRQADALAAYSRLRSSLVDELGIEAGASARDLQRRVLDQDPGLLVPPRPQRGPGTGTGRPATGVRAGLPALVGRDDVLDEIRASLDSRPLVTLVGPGGIGKTSLARALAAEVDDRVAVWCALSAVQGPEALVPALATAVGVRRTVGVTMLEAVRSSLASGPTLLVLDTCEHLLDAVVDVVDDLLARCPALTVLATSRERLSSAGETVWPIEGLALPGDGPDARHAASVVLFAQRAVEADPHFDLVGALDAVSQICRRLDGMPLAIELAASRVRALPSRAIAERLDHRFDLLVGGRRRGEPRHRTLRATVEWSHDLLGERQRLLFRRLAVFAGSFTLEGAEAVGARDGLPGAEVAGVLADLVDKSMVVVRHAEPDTRYRLLDTLRAFATDELAKAGESDAVERAYVSFHRALVAQLGEQVLGPAEPTAAARIRAGFDDVRRAVMLARRSEDLGALVDLVGGLGGYLRFHQGWEASDWAVDTLGVVERTAPDDLECLTALAGVAAWSQWFAGDLVAAEEIADRALAASDEVHAGTASVLAALAVAHMYNGSPQAVPVAERGLAVALDRGETFLAAYLAGALAITKAYAGSPDAARDDLARQATLVDALDNPSARAWSLYCQTEVAGDEDPERAVRVAREAAELARLAGSNLLENVCRITAVTVAARHRFAGGVRDEFSALIDRFRRDGAWTHVQVLVWNLVEVLAGRGRWEEAAVLLHAAPAGAPSPYGDQLARLDRGRAEAGAALAPGTFDAAAARGAGMTREEVASYALAVLGTLTDVDDVVPGPERPA